MGRLKIALLSGGWSSERGISIRSGEAVYRALDREKYDVTGYDPQKDLQDLIRAKGAIDLALILLHGKFGEDGRIQGLLDILGIPYVGSGVLSSALALNKRVAKILFKDTGLMAPAHRVLGPADKVSPYDLIELLGPVTVVKPVAEGSSIGMSVCNSARELKAGLEKAFRHDAEVMVEEYIDGHEVTCCVLGNRDLEALPLVEIVPEASYRFFDYDAKYTAGATREICPAPLSPAITEKAQACAKKAHEILQCRVWSRTDMIVRGTEIFVLETNTVPGMTDNSLFPLAARTRGLSLSALLDRLIELSLEGTQLVRSPQSASPKHGALTNSG